ncbi:hypothetical protein L2D08_07260 [Domibacillus sp. PGB-M46]|uniref:hypothetical protein n=1 Tax=Domibacillus sp. PGB-M46 TaxID=2910255 RepID=UPI001F55EE27|nr:hypothetical protein [Domibacillus sp. PGB-M46]MCI2254159.1 hypothetical protein [Domibacillus sp. PGB-M46]
MGESRKKQMLMSGIAVLFTLGLAGCGNEENPPAEQEEVEQNNHSDINEGMDEENNTGTNEDDQVEVDPNDGETETNQQGS